MKYIDSEKLIAEIEGRKKAIHATIFNEEYDELLSFITSLQQEQPSLPSNLDEAAIDAAQLDMQDRQIMEDSNEHRMLYSRIFRRGFKAGAEWQRELMEDEHGKELLYVCQKTAEREHRSGTREGKAQAEKELIPLINRLCEAILFEWKDAADLARKTLIQIKAREGEK